ncbi:hypothetical protein J2Y88_000385 [Pseudomonas chlororaphis]|uniref:DUF2474 domain-containing protein n=1 Tax=Pseudomonas chlororaphis TaxID=587753 RepID=UPI0020A117F3|nr:DUF2474 domain-containing protein [Pseudomonas chlororaphis]MCP1478074.1 hypothetical protein [Pseudomonas chlororaphis]MCP1595573.1 hypothetical protein [Pseudomonas chlororaphis]
MERSEVSTTGSPSAPWYRRLAWLVGIWLGSVLALGALASLLRLMMHMAGMSTH